MSKQLRERGVRMADAFVPGSRQLDFGFHCRRRLKHTESRLGTGCKQLLLNKFLSKDKQHRVNFDYSSTYRPQKLGLPLYP